MSAAELVYPFDLPVPVDDEALQAAIEERRDRVDELSAQMSRMYEEAAALEQLRAALLNLKRLEESA